MKTQGHAHSERISHNYTAEIFHVVSVTQKTDMLKMRISGKTYFIPGFFVIYKEVYLTTFKLLISVRIHNAM